jgi:hypothetical protein
MKRLKVKLQAMALKSKKHKYLKINRLKIADYSKKARINTASPFQSHEGLNENQKKTLPD